VECTGDSFSILSKDFASHIGSSVMFIRTLKLSKSSSRAMVNTSYSVLIANVFFMFLGLTVS